MMWLLAESIGGGVAEAITIDRDSATALRLAGATMGCAIILGRAAAGKWVSWDQTWGDLVQFGWPAVILAFAAGVLHRMLRPSAERPQPDRLAHGFVPAIVFVAAGILVVATGKNGFHPSQW
jgi:peptidoglycan/LPS O-acetylase OafA/YrhL